MIELVNTVRYTCDGCQRGVQALEQRRTDPAHGVIAHSLPEGWVEMTFGYGTTRHACSRACADALLARRT